jgi:hypothetical protein
MPNRFVPVNPGTPMEHVIAAINNNFAQLDSESAVKVFNGPNGKPAMIQGKLSNGFYGTAYVDQDGNTVKIEGFDSNGDFVELIVKDGEDAYTVLGY